MLRKKIVYILLVASFILSLILTICAAQEIHRIPGTPGDEATAFTLPDLNGKEVNLLKDFAKSKAIILVFSTTWCHFCVQEIPTLKAVYKKYKNKGVSIISVDPQEPKERVQALVNKYKIPYTVLLDVNGEVTKKYKVMGVPTILFLDQGRIIKWRSAGGEQDYDARLKELGIQ